MNKLLAIILLGLSSFVSAQTVQTTPNLLTSGTNHTWYGVTTGTVASDYMGGTSAPRYDPATNTVYFSYASGSPGQTMAVNQALASVGAGVKINGYTYSYDVRNMNGDDRQPGVDTFTVSQLLRGPQNSVLLSSNQSYNTKFEWRSVTGSKTATTPYNIADTTYIQFGVSGVDSGYWGGYFGPQIRNVDMRLTYTVDPCVANPAYSPSCPNYAANIITSPNLLSGTTGTQAYAINQALALSGSGVMIHGFNYGYNYNIGGTQCTATNQDGSCSWWMPSNGSVVTSIKDNNNSVIYSQSDTLQSNTAGTVDHTYLLPDSRNLSTLSTFKMAVGINGTGSVTNMYSKAIYTPDWCAQNPYYSPNCPGYNDLQISNNLLAGTTGPQAYAINQALAAAGSGATIHGFNYGYNYNVAARDCTVWDLFGLCISGWNYSDAGVNTSISNSAGSTIYSDNQTHNGGNNGTSGTYAKQYRLVSSAPMSTLGTFSMTPWTNGNASITNMYSRAVYTADPCLDPLSSTSCPGYQQAYFDQQCSFSALYNSACPGYTVAVFTQQCNANQLSDQRCPGYAAAYLTQQCTLDPLYSTTCSGYNQAYHDQQCGISALYASDCTGYTQAYHDNQCSLDPLYATDCTGYTAAYFTQQCTANQLYATTCPGYSQAYLNQQCLRDSLYSNQCEGYKTAYAIKYLVGLDSSVTSAVNSSLTNTVETQRNDPANVTGTVDAFNTTTASSSTSTSATTSAASVSPVAIISTIKPAPPAPQQLAQADTKKEEGPKNGNGNSGNSPSADNKPSDQPKSNREALQERRREAAQKEAVAKGKDLANEMGKAADMEAQKAVQNVVIQAMGFAPGFDTYNKAMIPDTTFYKPYTVYGNQKNVDNQQVGRRLMGGSDVKHQEMIDSQFNLGK